ncbi:MAG: tannase/feruloyl esterase family alpha/beta hydrolase [Clostridia bacterium]|nr:tannase/feruloyl esterase family alpha/beta hydrolase [Clostridia bacterium]
MYPEKLNSLASRQVSVTAHERFAGGLFRTKSNLEFADMPPFFRLRLIMKPVAASYTVTEIWLPDDENWNGRFVGLGNGGIAGVIQYPALARYLRMGYACANTDLGTSRGVVSGIDNPAVWDDFGWRATHLMTSAGKRAVGLYYGRPAQKSYFVGSSTGGQQAISEAERFPGDYDGILSCVAAMNRTALHTYFLWNWRVMRYDGIGPAFTQMMTEEIHRLALEFCRGFGGALDGDCFVSCPLDGEDTPDRFVEFIGKNSGFFKAEDLERLRDYYRGPRDPRTGKKIYGGVPIGAEISPGGMERACKDKVVHYFPFVWAFGAGYPASDFDFASDYDRLNEKLGPHVNATSGRLGEFSARGGKMIGFSGTADPVVPYHESLAYCDMAAKEAGGPGKLGEFFRFYVLPGRSHSSRAGAVDLFGLSDSERNRGALAALEKWVEEGVAPFEMLAVSEADPDDTSKQAYERVIYPYALSEKCPFTKFAGSF